MSNLTASSPRSASVVARRIIAALFLMTLIVGCGSESSTSMVVSDAAERESAEPEQTVFTTAIHNYSNSVPSEQ